VLCLSRVFLTQNIVVKKYVSGVDGASGLMEAVGFRKVEIGPAAKKVQYLSIEEADVRAELLDRSMELIAKQLEATEKGIPQSNGGGAGPARQIVCTGGMGNARATTTPESLEPASDCVLCRVVCYAVETDAK
jgi:hypothetical protein